MNAKSTLLSLAGGMLLACTPILAAGGQSAFKADSLDQIEQTYAGEGLLLVMWEINCMPCREELGLLGRARENHPDMNLVLISTDDIALAPQVREILANNNLTGVDSWMFAEQNVEKLRYAVDPEWFGELPRNDIYDEDHNRIGFSGKLSEEVLEEWLEGDS